MIKQVTNKEMFYDYDLYDHDVLIKNIGILKSKKIPTSLFALILKSFRDKTYDFESLRL